MSFSLIFHCLNVATYQLFEWWKMFYFHMKTLCFFILRKLYQPIDTL